MDATGDGADDGSGDAGVPWPEVNAADRPLTWTELTDYLEYLVRFVIHDPNGSEAWRVETDDHDVFVTFTTDALMKLSVAASAVVVPGRRPASMSACLHQPRNVSALTPTRGPIRFTTARAAAFNDNPGSCAWASSTSLRARSRSSFGYFLGAGTTPPFRGFRPSSNPGGASDLQDESCPPEVRQLGRTISKWRHEISAWHHAHVSNGPTEAANNLIKVVKRIAFGFTSFRNYRIRSLLNAVKPNWNLLGGTACRCARLPSVSQSHRWRCIDTCPTAKR